MERCCRGNRRIQKEELEGDGVGNWQCRSSCGRRGNDSLRRERPIELERELAALVLYVRRRFVPRAASHLFACSVTHAY